MTFFDQLRKANQEVATVENYSTKLVWEDGRPRIMGAPMNRGPVSQQMRHLLEELMYLPYDGSDPRFVGLTKLEAMMATLVDEASRGDKDARKEILDRVLGRPVQNIKSLSVKGTIEDFLDSIEPKEVIDVTPPRNEADDL